MRYNGCCSCAFVNGDIIKTPSTNKLSLPFEGPTDMFSELLLKSQAGIALDCFARSAATKILS
jgi:hypothetical protein